VRITDKSVRGVAGIVKQISNILLLISMPIFIPIFTNIFVSFYLSLHINDRKKEAPRRILSLNSHSPD